MAIEDFAKRILAEDIGRGDLFSRVAASKPAKAKIVAKSEGVLAGVVYADAIAKIVDIEIDWQKEDADRFEKGDLIAYLQGSSNDILAAERAILNTLLHASSIAANTKKMVEIAEKYGVKLLDTRKTRPLLREFEKYAVRVGGAINHRFGLDDALMLKDTHLKTVKNLKEFIKKARKKIPFTAKIEVECENYEKAKEAMEAGADIVMCDNMDVDEIKKTVLYKKRKFPHILIEASGNITVENIEEYAKTGIDAISSGSIVHQAVWPDISMKFL
ncbi:carboxylating nicotinate-nucleotide diphosphorylase [Nitrosophilus alvini]|uniref:carboxylating nicotinate-nucleotide diphosphorylase n=1 Tax=Nitrosophilus alvini TaxID=2714855 RepID=UPI003B82E591